MPDMTLTAAQRALQRWFPTLPDSGSDWRDQALCAQADPELWFPDGDHTISQGQKAKAICRTCPVQAECLEEALTSGERFGVWGGLTATERNRLRSPARERTHCRNGHAWTPDNTRITSVGTRRCRKCDSDYQRAARQRQADRASRANR